MCSVLTGKSPALCWERLGEEKRQRINARFTVQQMKGAQHVVHVLSFMPRACVNSSNTRKSTSYLSSSTSLSLPVCVPPEECLCQNGGVCVDINGTCECPSGYTGLYCQFGEYDTCDPIGCLA